jgi:AcrR family transcriptional regulator
MPLPRFDKLEPERRQRLLAAAAQEFAAHGLEGASLIRIAEASGMSKGSLYYYFEDKADLFASAVKAAWQKLFAAAEDALDVASLDASSFWPSLRAFNKAILARCGEEPWLVAAAKLTYHPDAAGRAGPALVATLAHAQELQQRVFRRGQELGVVRTDLPEDLLLNVVGAADQAGDHWVMDHWEALTPEGRAEIAGRLFEIVRAIATPPAPDHG